MIQCSSLYPTPRLLINAARLYPNFVERTEQYQLSGVEASDPEVLVETKTLPAREREVELSTRRVFFHLLLFGITCVTTTITGMSWWVASHSEADSPDSFFEPVVRSMRDTANGNLDPLVNGVIFTVTLLAILGAHEFGHYFACRYYGVRATLPFFIPAPPVVTFFGTFGAVIKIKSPITSRKALFDIGIAGPLAGFALALPVSVIGLWVAEASRTSSPPPGSMLLQDPPLFKLLNLLLDVPPLINWNPAYWAAWAALLVTALNLFPVGQLDGGHVLYAVAGRRVHKWLSLATALGVGALAIVSLVKHGSPIWLLWTAVLLFLTKVGHPPVSQEEPLGAARGVLAIVAVVVFFLCFMPFPITFE
jgi:membrane-associated protease RseP (regulator of RpoE activity)